jgi:hypothetical protein
MKRFPKYIIKTLQASVIEDRYVWLPPELDLIIYPKVAAFLTSIGGEWNDKLKCFIFPKGTTKLKKILKSSIPEKKNKTDLLESKVREIGKELLSIGGQLHSGSQYVPDELFRFAELIDLQRSKLYTLGFNLKIILNKE